MIVVDAAAVVDYLTGSGGVAEQVRVELERHDAVAPQGIDLECASALRGLVLGDRLTAQDAQDALTVLAEMPLRRFGHLPLMDRVWELRDNAQPYDASYLALAELLTVDLVTIDAKLARVPGIRCVVRNLREE